LGVEETRDPGDDDADGGDDAVAEVVDVFYLEFEADDEEEEDGAEYGEVLDEGGVCDDVEDAGPDEDAEEDLADDDGLFDLGEDEVGDEGGEEEDRELQDDAWVEGGHVGVVNGSRVIKHLFFSPRGLGVDVCISLISCGGLWFGVLGVGGRLTVKTLWGFC